MLNVEIWTLFARGGMRWWNYRHKAQGSPFPSWSYAEARSNFLRISKTARIFSDTGTLESTPESGLLPVRMDIVRIGIDFGTTRIVVAAADRGNYPLVNFEAPDGRIRDWFPSVLAVSQERRFFGWEALELQGKPGWTIVRSLKRWLKNAGPHSEIEVDGQRFRLSQVMAEMMAALRRELLHSSTLGTGKSEPLQVMLGVPANANSN